MTQLRILRTKNVDRLQILVPIEEFGVVMGYRWEDTYAPIVEQETEEVKCD